MPLDHEEISTTDALPPELQDVHEQLLADGADWRTELDQRTAGYEHEDWTPTRQKMTTEIQTLVSAQRVLRSLRPMRYNNRRGLLAIAAMLAVVVLLAALLRAAAQGRTQIAAHKTPVALSTPIATSTMTLNTTPQWTMVPLHGKSPAMLAPSNPRIIYSPQSQPPLSIQRSDDAGETWQNLPLPFQIPAESSPGGWGFNQFVIDPINPQIIYLDAAINSAALCTSFGQSPDSSLVTYAAMVGERASHQASSGSHGCSVQFYSADGGEHWHVLNLRVQGQLALYPYATSYLVPQGSRLYSSVTAYGPATGLQPLGRLVSSSDGIHWQTSDNALIARGLGIDEYAPTPDGSTVFAVVEPVDTNLYSVAESQHPPLTPAYQLWRTDDAGYSWYFVGGIPDNAIPAMYATMVHGKPILYILTAFASPATASMLEYSNDGGTSWHAIPTDGIPANLQISLPLLGQLADGSILVLVTVNGGSPTGGTTFFSSGTHLLAWKPGQAQWREVAPPLEVNGVSMLLIEPPDATGAQTLWAQVEDDLNPSDLVQRYTITAGT